MKLLLTLLLHLHLAIPVICTWCPPCCDDQLDCMKCSNPPAPSSCISGEVTLDNCLCCTVCARAVGEVCGGWHYAGASTICARGLYCKYPPGISHSDFNSGICAPI